MAAENELLGAASSIEAASIKLAQLKPRDVPAKGVSVPSLKIATAGGGRQHKWGGGAKISQLSLSGPVVQNLRATDRSIVN